MIRKGLFILCLLVSFASLLAQPINQATPEANLQFALELFERKDFFNAKSRLETAYEYFPTNDIAYKIGVCEYQLRDYRAAERWFARVMRRDKIGEFPEAQFWRARMLKMQGKYEDAIGEFNDIVKSDAEPLLKRRAQQELLGATMALEAPESKRLTFDNAGKDLNKPGSEGSVFVAPSGQELYFTSYEMEDMIEVGDSADIQLSRAHVAEWSEDKWSRKGPLSEMVNREDYHTGSVSISPDGNRMYFTRVIMKTDSMAESKIYMSGRQGSDWGPAYEVSGVNGDWHARFPCIGEHFGSEVLFFVAELPGGHGGTDIYYARRIDDLNFGDPINLGDVINGPGDEISPFYRDGRLYFASDSYASFGGLDIFFSDWDGSKWSVPENMGKGFNTPQDDFNFSVDASGRRGALLSNRVGGKSLYSRTCCDDIYTFDLAPVTVELIVSVQESEKNRPLRGVPVQLIEMTGDQMGVTKTQSTADKGATTFELGVNKAWMVIAAAPGFFPDTIQFNTADIKDNITMEKLMVIEPMPRDPEYEIYTIEEAIRLNSIYYNYDDDKILPDAEPDLQLLTDLLNQYPDMVIELSSHTDARGNDDYNQRLSQRRAQSAKNWIVAQGISEDRIQAVGYGETQILNHCVNNVDCTDEEHRYNRRTEFKIISGPTTIQIEKKRLKEDPGQGSVTPPRPGKANPANTSEAQFASKATETKKKSRS
jgi:peptidoglycan-associated lipoprotein